MNITTIISAIVAALLITGASVGVSQLDAAKLPEGVTDVTVGQDQDDGKTHYDVEFRAEGKEYELEVDPQSGEILELKTEPVKMPAKPKSEPQTAAPTQQTVALLTAQEVKTLALADAGLTEEQAKHLRAQFEWDDGLPEWEVEFTAGRWEYEYKIHGQTGAIIEQEKDRD